MNYKGWEMVKEPAFQQAKDMGLLNCTFMEIVGKAEELMAPNELMMEVIDALAAETWVKSPGGWGYVRHDDNCEIYDDSYNSLLHTISEHLTAAENLLEREKFFTMISAKASGDAVFAVGDRVMTTGDETPFQHEIGVVVGFADDDFRDAEEIGAYIVDFGEDAGTCTVFKDQMIKLTEV